MKIQLFRPQAVYEIGKRANQEDSIYPAFGNATEDSRLFMVCDGMGGHEKGEVASKTVCQAMSQATEQLMEKGATVTKDMLKSILNDTYEALDKADVFMEGKMGTTMALLCLHRGGAICVHIGDSRIYHLRPKLKGNSQNTNEVVRYRSRDHSLVQHLYEMGELSYNDMATSPKRNIVLRAMQPYQEKRANPTMVCIADIQPGDYFYLCSDGMLEQMDDEELTDIIGSDMTDLQKALELMNRTVDNSDNHSAYLVHVKDVEHERGDDLMPDDEQEARQRNKALNDKHKDLAWSDDTAGIDPQQTIRHTLMNRMITFFRQKWTRKRT